MFGDIVLQGGNDIYNGSAGRLTATVFAGVGDDKITGGIDSDRFEGEAGKDTLTGGAGRDLLTGGLDADTFDFNSISESKKGALRDQVLDFTRLQGDKIDLTTIDADTSANPGNDVFKFIGTAAFKGGGGEIRCSGGIIQGDVDGNKVADFEIKVNLATMVAADFFL
jgi:serralysin